MTKDKTINRTRKNCKNPYVMINKIGIDDPRLSLKSKGILVTLLAKPDDWKIYITHRRSFSAYTIIHGEIEEISIFKRNLSAYFPFEIRSDLQVLANCRKIS